MDLTKLRERRAALLSECKALVDAAEKEDRNLTDAEQKTFDEKRSEAEALKSRIERAQNVQDDIDQVPPRRTSPEGPENRRLPDVEVSPPNLAKDPTGGYGRTIDLRSADLRNIYVRSDIMYGFGDFALDVRKAAKGDVSPRLRKWDDAVRAAGDGLTAGIGHEGGWLIPTQFSSMIDRIAIEGAIVRPRATVIQMSSPRVIFPVVDDTTHASTVAGGLLAYFKSEEAQLTSSKPQFGQMELDLHKLTALAYCSGELLDWSPISMNTWLPAKMAQALVWKEEQKFVSGTGTGGEPTGLLNAGAIISITKETGQAAATIVFENIVKMWARLWAPVGRGNVFWIANRTILPQLAGLTIDVGTGGMPVFLPAGGLTGAPYETILGKPVIFTEHAKALGTAGDLMLVNGSEYLIGDASGKMRTDRDISLKFDYDQVAFRVITYVGGMLPWRTAFQPENGDTLSPVVVIAARS